MMYDGGFAPRGATFAFWGVRRDVLNGAHDRQSE